MLPQLVAIEEEPRIDGLLVLLNTVGGDVEAGLAIAELLAGMKNPRFLWCWAGTLYRRTPGGGGEEVFHRKIRVHDHSSCADERRSAGVPQTLEYFQRMQDRITSFVAENSNITPERFYELSMNTEELVMDGYRPDGEDAVKEGLIDRLGNLSDALQCLYDMIDDYRENEGAEDKKTTAPKHRGKTCEQAGSNKSGPCEKVKK